MDNADFPNYCVPPEKKLSSAVKYNVRYAVIVCMKTLKVLILPLLLAAVLPLGAQPATPRQEAESFSRQFTEAYDSLMNSYYLRRHAHHSLRHSRQFSLEEFDALPDSLLLRRMNALHTVIPMTYNAEVRQFIRFYLNHLSTRMDVMLTLCEYYHPTFEETLNRYGVPEELKYLTIVESAMNPMATSRVGAAGLWQFMYSTGKIYDLEVNSVVDDRRDTYKSTVAAARHLADLHRVFGDWQLAIAAYNCGAGNVNKAIARSGGRRSFWEIYYNLPRETRGYVPAFLAVVYVMNYYELHGLRPERLNLPIRSDTVAVHDDMLLSFVSQYAGIDPDELRTLNPQYRAGYIPGATGRYALCLPTTAVDRFLAMQDTIAARSADSLTRRPVEIKAHPRSQGHSGGSRTYTVRKGDTLSSIARKHGISVSTLKKRNGLKGDKIRVGQKLKV